MKWLVVVVAADEKTTWGDLEISSSNKLIQVFVVRSSSLLKTKKMP